MNPSHLPCHSVLVSLLSHICKTRDIISPFSVILSDKLQLPQCVVMRAILLPPDSANQIFPSKLGVMPVGALLAVGIGNSVICPEVVIRPILLPMNSSNHRLPSGPGMMPIGMLFALMGATLAVALGLGLDTSVCSSSLDSSCLLYCPGRGA